MRRLAAGVCLGFFGLAAAWGQQAAGSAKCADLAKLALPHTTITRSELAEAGKFSSPVGEKDKDPIYGKLPAFCRVTAEAHPSADSRIAIEVWLPIEGWNGRFLGVGNGGFAGQIDFHHLAVAVQSGYATAGTDTGHAAPGTDAAWALGHPEKIADFGYRGVHEMSLTGEAVAQAFYGRAAGHRYFAACSDGGREALMEAQRFPGDYDGILAGAPAYNWTHLVSSALFLVQSLEAQPGSYIPAAKLPAISAAVLAKCGRDTSPGFLDDPRQCQFDPTTLLCKASEDDRCLTAAQVKALKDIYEGAHTRDGKAVNYGLLPGAELGPGGWELWITGSTEGKSLADAFGGGYFENMVYGKAGLDIKKLTLDEALKQAIARTSGTLDAVNPDLSAFSAHGGKLILYHGWNDPAIPSRGTVDYFNRVVAAAGEAKASEFARLFMVPGMQHCSGGPGATGFGQGGPTLDAALDNPEHNIYRALESWVETGTAPEKMIAQKVDEQGGKPAVIFSRPLCPYPQAAAYSGAGDRNDAASYSCSLPK